MISSARNEPSAKAESILEAAKKSFLAHGFGAVSMEAIAREAQVSKATVYAHFSSKEELFGAVIGRECERRFAGFSAQELDPKEAHASLAILGRRFLELILSPDAIALHRIILGEVTRFPVLGEVFWNAGPERNLRQIAEFMAEAAAAGTLALDDPRLAAEQFAGLVRGEVQLRQLLCLDDDAGAGVIGTAVESAVATFLRAYRPAP
jgi:TetR/AcrR family transcriptional regulator, mexJK operon transcriptional repressor